MKKLFLTLFIASLSLAPTKESGAQATNQPKIDGVDAGIFIFDNMLYHELEYGNGRLPMREYMLYRKAEYFFTLDPKATFGDLCQSKRFITYVNDQNITYLGGPMLGDIKSDGISVWVRTAKADKVRVEVYLGDEKKEFESELSSAENDFSVTIPVTGLKPNTQYTYKVFVGDQEITTKTDYSFHTLSTSLKDNTHIIFGADYHRYGLTNVKQSQTMVSRGADACLLLGDIAVQDKMNFFGYHCLDFLARDLYPAWQNLASKVPVYTTWDDHDYFNDDVYNVGEGFTTEDKEGVWEVFKNSWVNPSYGFGEEGKGVFHSSTIGAADVILLDNRYFREKGSLLGKEQHEWLKDKLLSSKSPFIIIGCGTMFSDYVSKGKDSWGVFSPEAREEIFTLIEENDIAGVLFISGDRHGSRGFKIEQPSGYTFYEFGSGSLGGLGGQPATTPEWKDVQLYGHSSVFAFGEFVFDTKVKDPTVSFKLLTENGDELYGLTLKRSELTPSKKKK